MIGTVGYFVLLFTKADRIPPLVLVYLIANMILLNVIQIALAVQLYKVVRTDWIGYLFYVYHFNVLLLSALLEVFFVLAGQGLDAPVKAFTDTADWTFSQQIPPPPLEYEGHYLCTVAAGGHGKVVKPIRLGRRRGAVIVVNRQLCVANAFEEAVAERFPALHRKIRHAYDTYGYPLSNLITTRGRADAVYILMKPLEWVFLLYLYLIDARPEERISRQYKM
ncbi:MAG: hypothetical protein J6O00_04175 [Clostridiales bacterium]|nr:hypothetical protein [Clostridiales bacterium]